MRIDYARTSTTEQEAGLEAQRRELTAYGCEELFEEQVSSVSRRDELERCLKFVRKGDSLVVTKLDRLARSVPDLVKIIRRLEEIRCDPQHPRHEPRHQQPDRSAIRRQN
jgi:DNA invertase Pin-like site-specific DNA recombinase